MKHYNRLKLLPLQFILAVLPLITYFYTGNSGYAKYGWNTQDDSYMDFFLHYKMLTFFVITLILLFGVVVVLRRKTGEQTKKYLLWFAPMLVYLFLTILSTVFSKDIRLSLLGAVDQKEPFPVLLGYVLTCFYTLMVVEREEDVNALVKAAILGASLMSLIGVLQAIGKDPFTMETVQRLIADDSWIEENGVFMLRFPVGMSYGTLFNPNYVGSYVALYLPFLFYGLLHGKGIWKKLFSLIVMIGLLILLFTSQSRTGLIAMGAILVVMLFFSVKYVIKYWYLIIPAITAGVLGFLLVDAYRDSFLTTRLKQMFEIEKKEYELRGFDTTGNGVRVLYKDTEFTVMMPVAGEDFSYIVMENNQKRPVTYADNKNMGYATLENGDVIEIQTAVCEDEYAFGLSLGGRNWYFTNQIEPRNYKFITVHGKLDECIAAEVVFLGYEDVASNRVYAWGRTIPLLKQHILIGSGPDTFAIVFPQNDYVGRYNTGNLNSIFTRPHNFYLQTALQTGVLSLLALLCFLLCYILQCCKLYFVRKFDSKIQWMGFFAFLSVIGFMAAGFANDSLIVVSPVFYLLLGMGMAINKGSLEEEAVSGRDSKESGRDSKESGKNSKVSGRNSKVSGKNSKESGRNSKVSGKNSKESGRDKN